MSLIKKSDISDMIEGEKEAGKEIYALSSDSHSFYPITNEQEIRKSASHFVQNRDKYPFRWRKQIAGNILKAAGKIGADVPHSNYIHKAAGMGIGSAEEVSKHLYERAEILPENDRAELQKLASELEDTECDVKTTQACAEVLATIDEKNGVYKDYKNGVKTPEECAFTYTKDDIDKEASSMTKLANDQVISKEELGAMPIAKAASAIGGDAEKKIIGEIPDRSGVLEVVANLSKKDANTFCSFVPKQAGEGE